MGVKIALIDPGKDERWDRFVNDHPFGWICHLSGWKSVLDTSFPHMQGHYFALMDGDDIKAALPLFLVRSRLTGTRLVSIPFATLCDPLVNNEEDSKLLFDAAIDLAKATRASYIEIRTLRASVSINDDRFGVLKQYKHHYLPLLADSDVLMRTFDRNVRRCIKSAYKNNLSVRIGDTASDLEQFYRLYLNNRKRLSLPPQPFRFIQALWETFSPFGITLLLAENSGESVAGILLLKHKNRVSAEFLADDERFREMNPGHLLYWEAIKLAKNEGAEIFDFGRTAQENVSLIDFKRKWGTSVFDLPHYYYPKSTCELMTDNAHSLGYFFVRQLCSIAPTPLFKSLGEFCYRHLG